MKNITSFFKYKVSGVFCCLFMILTDVGATPLDSIMLRFFKDASMYSIRIPQEKVYLHLDNNAYFQGETLWFKAYVVLASSLTPSPMSKVLYVELLSPSGQVVQERRLKIENGQANGEFSLKDIIHTGYYQVRAYTRAMLNWDEAYMFSRVIPIFDAPAKDGDYLTPKFYETKDGRKLLSGRKKSEDPIGSIQKDNIRMAFYPEGGKRVKDIRSQIAFLLTTSNGNAIDSICRLYNDKGNLISTFQPVHLGMGIFELPADFNTGYVLVGNNPLNRFDIPSPTWSGVVLTADRYTQTDSLQMRIQVSKEWLNNPIGVCISNRGKVCYFGKLQMTTAEVKLSLPDSVMDDGVNQLTLFNTSGRKLAERLLYKRPSERELQLQVKQDEDHYSACSPVNIELSLTNPKKKPISTTFSVAVHDADCEVAGRENTLPIDLLLTSDLKGYIENPGYYFEKDDASHRRALDLLLMVQGWRRYDWDEMIGTRPFQLKQPMEDGLLMFGKVAQKWKPNIIPEVEVELYAEPEKGYALHGRSRTDSLGRFFFKVPDFYGTCDGIFATNIKGKKKSSRVMLDRFFSPEAFSYGPSEERIISLPRDEKKSLRIFSPDSLLNIPKGNILPTATVKAKRVQNIFTHNGGEKVGRRYMDRIYDMKLEYERMRDIGQQPDTMGIIDWLRLRVPEFDFNKVSFGGRPIILFMDNIQPKLLDFKNIQRSQTKFINYQYKGGNMPRNMRKASAQEEAPEEIIYPLSLLNKIIISEDPKTVYKFIPKMELRNNIQTSSLTESLVTIFAYSKYEDTPVPRGQQRVYIFGYDKPMVFYNPLYGETEPKRANDYRRTLYWNPNVTTNQKGQAYLHFFTNSRKDGIRFHLSAVGVTNEGLFLDYEK